MGGVQPRPPSGPADQALLKIQRTRVRMVSAGKSEDIKTEGVDPTYADRAHNTAPLAISSAEYQNPVLSSDEQLAVRVLCDKGSLTAHQSISEPTDEQVYSYRSTPKSAETRLSSVQVRLL